MLKYGLEVGIQKVVRNETYPSLEKLKARLEDPTPEKALKHAIIYTIVARIEEIREKKKAW